MKAKLATGKRVVTLRRNTTFNTMKIFSMIIALLVATSFNLLAADGGARNAKKAKAPKESKQAKTAKQPKGKLYHVVAFKFKADATPEQIKEVEDAFEALKGKVAEIKSLEWGTNVSPEKHDKGFTHCFVLTFKKEADRDAYLVHPAHKAFGALVGPVMDDVFVVDFWGKK